ncbi:unnamed protein product [Effrenium voratum]|nr:unnamed protein product [Effrenium voratum]
MYVADSGAKKIFRFHVYQQNVGGSLQLSTDGVQLCVSQNVNSNWVSVDINGDVFYTDASTNTINRIPVEVIEKLTTGQYAASDLMLLSEKTLESGGGATSNVALSRYVYSVYEGNVNPHVTTPGGVVSDGARLYWANTVDGTTAGVLVEGQVDPQLPQAKSGEPVPTAFPSRVLSNTSSAGYGVTKSSKYVFLSSVNEGVGVVYGVTEGGVSFDLVGGLSTPRGLVWDGDQTVFVADEAAGVVYAFPAGRLMSDAPLTKSAVLTGAFGLALMSEQDKAWPMQPFQN